MSFCTKRLLATGLTCLGLAASVAGQTTIESWRTPNRSGFFDRQYEFYRQLSDIDGDGVPEIVLPDRSQQPQVALWAYSMAKDEVLFTIPTPVQHAIWEFHLITLNDIDGDGLRDIVVSYLGGFPAPPTERFVVRAFSGLDGMPLWSMDEAALPDLGLIWAVGDVNADGVEDFGTSQRGACAHVLSGADGTVIQTLTSGTICDFDSLRPAGDIDGDGCGDVIAETCGPRIYSGRTGEALTWAHGPTYGAPEMYAIGVGDVNGDGLDDWAEGWSASDPYWPTTEPSRIVVLSGIPPVIVAEILPGRGDRDTLHRGEIFHLDYDLDGTQDLLFQGSSGEDTHHPRYTSIYSPAKSEELMVWGQTWIDFMDLSEDWNGDGFDDMLGVLSSQRVEAFHLRPVLQVSPTELSRTTGATLHFSVDVGAYYGGHRARLLPGDGGEWPFTWKFFWLPDGWQYLMLPFTATDVTDRVWGLQGNRAVARFRTGLDADGRGRFTIPVPPGRVSSYEVGTLLRFTVLLEGGIPGYPEATTEAVTVQIIP